MPSWDNGTPTGLRPAPSGLPSSILGDGVFYYLKMNKKTGYKIILLILLLLGFIDYQFNPQRIIFTAKILGLPAFMNYPILILEHSLGFMALGFFLLIVSELIIPSLKEKRIVTLTKINGPWFLAIIFLLIVFSIFYEIFDQKCANCWQMIFDFIGIIIFYKYTKYGFNL